MTSPDRSILITGCSSGIGLASVRIMRDRGWRVLATARTPEDLDHLEREEHVEALHLELANPASIAACAEAALAKTDGKLTALFSNAAYGQPGAVEDITPECLRHQLEVNVVGTHDLTQRLIPAMRRNGYGRIVQCSSVLGLVVVPYRGAYCASKFALEALTDSLRMELSGSGVSVSLIEPGPIRTRFVENALAAFKANVDIEHSAHREAYLARIRGMEAGGQSRFKLEPEAVADKLVHAVECPRPRRRYYVTTPTYLAATFKRIFPAGILEYLSQKI